MNKSLEKFESWIVYATIFIVPLAVTSFFANPFALVKSSILAFGVGLAILVWMVRTLLNGKLEIHLGKFDLPILLLGMAYVVSTIWRTPNKMEALLLPGTTTVLVSGVLLYFLINQFSKPQKAHVIKVLGFSAAFHSLLIGLAALGLFEQIPQLPNYIKLRTFSPLGGYLPSAMFLAIILPSVIAAAMVTKKSSEKIVLYIASGLILLGTVLSVIGILPGKPTTPRFPSLQTSWAIAIDSLKESPLGVGPGNYLTAFNRYRPIQYNSTDIWAVKYTTANNFYLTLMSETGLLGTAAAILLVWNVYKFIRKDIKEKKLVGWGFSGNASIISLALVLVLVAFYPATVTLMIVMFAFLALAADTHKTTLNLTAESSVQAESLTKGVATKFPAMLVTIPVIVFIGFIFFKGGTYLKAEYLFKQSLEFLARNQEGDAIRSYDTIGKAINTNPLVDRYHMTYSQINLAIANSILLRAINSQEQEVQNEQGSAQSVTDEDRNTIAQLIQQAIREGKAGVALNRFRAGNWEVLARTYAAIRPLAQGADAYAAQTYSQAVQLDPLNPNLRIALGGIFYASGDYKTAINIFSLAANIKPDLANSHYNLAFAYSQDGQLQRAIGEMSLVLSLVDPNSNDYNIARQAMDELEKKQKEAEGGSSENLTSPTEGEDVPELEPPLELPEDANPPEAPITPTPTPNENEAEVTTTPQITPTPTINP